MIVRPLCSFLSNDAHFVFNDKYHKAFEILKKTLTSTPIIQPSNWGVPFKIMCDASNYVVGAVWGSGWRKFLMSSTMPTRP
jgi:hypothetical protein